MLNDLRSIVLDKSFRITIYEDKVDINSCDELLMFDDVEILIKSKTRILKIRGSNLAITRFENNEVLISGKIKSVDLG